MVLKPHHLCSQIARTLNLCQSSRCPGTASEMLTQVVFSSPSSVCFQIALLQRVVQPVFSDLLPEQDSSEDVSYIQQNNFKSYEISHLEKSPDPSGSLMESYRWKNDTDFEIRIGFALSCLWIGTKHMDSYAVIWRYWPNLSPHGRLSFSFS